VEASGADGARQHREKARTMHQQARKAYDAGDYPGAVKLLADAAREMFEGVRMAAPEQVTAAKKQRDFEARRDSVRALLAAQKRIVSEKGAAAKGAESMAQVEKLLDEASRLAGSDLDKARSVLDQAYLLAKAGISNLRGGDTLVRSLQFASKEEEYHYEVDRNDTHKMLVKVLLDERRATQDGLDAKLQPFLDKSDDLRKAADAKATDKDFEGAIDMLEESTRELVRAIRGAGVYIPG
jgi:hypothetical protein